MESQYEHWNQNLLSLTSEQFEELCLDIVKALGRWVNVKWAGRSGDKGRDITAEKIEKPDGINTTIQRWFFQCKRYQSGVPAEEIAPALDWAHAERANYIVLMSNNRLTTNCGDLIEKRKSNLHPTVLPWTDVNFIDLLLSLPHVVAKWFPNEKLIPPPKKPEVLFEFAFNIPSEKASEIAKKLTELATPEKKIHIRELLALLDGEILGAGLIIDDNVKAIVYQQFSMVLASRNLVEATKYLEKAVEINPKNRLTLHQLAYLLIQAKRFDEAQRCYNKVLEMDEEDKNAWNNLGSTLNATGKSISAKKCFEKALKIDPLFSLARRNLALVHTKNKRFIEATLLLKEGLKLKEDPIILDGLGLILKELGAYEESAKQHTLATKIASSSISSWNDLGVALEHLARSGEKKDIKAIEEALNCFQKVTALQPSNALGWANKSVCWSQLGDSKNAMNACEQALQLDPNEPTALSQKAIFLCEAGKPDEGLALVEKTLKANATSGLIHKSLLSTKVRLLHKKGRIRAALITLDNAIKNEDYPVELLELKAKIMLESKDESASKKLTLQAEVQRRKRSKILNQILSTILR